MRTIKTMLLTAAAIPTYAFFDGDETPKFEMPATVDSIDSVPDAFKGFYEEKNGKFALADVTGLKKALTTTRAERDANKGKAGLISKWEKLGKTPEEIEALLAKEAEDETKRAKKEGDFETLKTQMATKHAKDIGDKDNEIAGLNRTVEKLLVDSEAVKELARAKGSQDLLLPHVRSQVKVLKDEATGEFVARVVDAKGEPRVGNSKGDYMTIGQLVDEMRESPAYGRAFDADENSGTGSESSGNGKNGNVNAVGKAKVPKKWADATTKEERAAYLREKHKNGNPRDKSA